MVDAHGDGVSYVVEAFRVADDSAESAETVFSSGHFCVCRGEFEIDCGED